ncbi:MAG TPA: GIY-YIG nuclease family protein [Ignavibacteriales bacterium]|nr:GIY-YIG nuclease family protein [Ignavibacteriales bacterium]
MPDQIKSNSGAYLLEIYAPKPFKIRKGRFEGLCLSEGYYYYAGSAQKNLRQRLERHLRKNKTLHWHIDYITSLAGNKITNFWIFEDASKETECRITQRLILEFNLRSVIKGFGSSDCRNCESHLLASGKVPLAGFSI